MLFSEPPPSDYDLRFRLFDVPVRVHPFFWLLILIGVRRETRPLDVLIWTAALFVSIVVHEFGHVFAFRYYGIRSHVVLYGFGGLAVPYSRGRLGPRADMFISFAGPLAGFIFAAVLVLGLRLSGVTTVFRVGLPEIVDWRFFDAAGGGPSFMNAKLYSLLWSLMFINIFWGLVNLLPIYPLDGGQIARAASEEWRVRDGLRKTLILSMVAAGGMALYGLKKDSFFTAIMFAYMAYDNYRELQGGGYDRGW